MLYSFKVYAIFCLFITISEVILLNVDRYKWPWISVLDFLGGYIIKIFFYLPVFVILFLVNKFVPKYKTLTIVSVILLYDFYIIYPLPYTWTIDSFEIWVDGKPGKDFFFYYSFKVISMVISILLALKIIKVEKDKILKII